ncbi:phage tail sheath C-terminal domain-containing protein [Dyadobacter sp. NIV53]|uniref:phage tail sheath C-terminal domain-containing protein n=1 Tax=Dyadobacter sp. NIV53 TaxID=2861765 RepID=UPI001E601438|nr:phage tail sheath C-terminal domain-containing protein [Dyadobacter sp. NIV53]
MEEISIFPPSVAQVDTAIPAFIGYTEKAQLLQPGDLLNVAQEVNSFAEFNLYFGFGPPVNYTSIEIDATNGVSKINSKNMYYLYDSMQLFYANGGGKCFIISVGLYPKAVDKADFDAGIQALRKKDDPTMIVFPDAVALATPDFHALQQSALVECGDVNTRVDVNRFAVLDLQEGATDLDWQNGVNAFRDSIGINNLKYGAVYTPWLKAILTKTVSYRDLIDTSVAAFPSKLQRSGSGINVAIMDLASSYSAADKANILAQLTSLNNAVSDALTIQSDFNTVKISTSEFGRLTDSLTSKTTVAAKLPDLVAIFDYLYTFADLLQKYTVAANIKTVALNTQAAGIITGIQPQYVKLISHDKGADAVAAFGASFTRFDAAAHATNTHPNWATIFGAGSPAALDTIFNNATATTDPIRMAQMMASIPMLREVFDSVYVGLATLKTAAETNETTLQKALFDGFPGLNNIVTALKRSSTTVPPSGAMAGIYSYVDGNRGVWKAPANVSLNSVSAVTVEIDDKKQETLNVHDTGKSINVIRKFTGRGIIVWGARTLAGNDNEWRYVPVRRFYNMVEESVKKACLQFVFEANDANTWVKVRSMIENYLNTLWRQGALAGAKSEQAYYVRVGLGTTMTFQDVLEGKMIVRIAMAPVRPAEFIILEFSQKQQES